MCCNTHELIFAFLDFAFLCMKSTSREKELCAIVIYEKQF